MNEKYPAFVKSNCLGSQTINCFPLLEYWVCHSVSSDFKLSHPFSTAHTASSSLASVFHRVQAHHWFHLPVPLSLSAFSVFSSVATDSSLWIQAEDRRKHCTVIDATIARPTSLKTFSSSCFYLLSFNWSFSQPVILNFIWYTKSTILVIHFFGIYGFCTKM